MTEWSFVYFKEMKYVDIPQCFSLLNVPQTCAVETRLKSDVQHHTGLRSRVETKVRC